MEPDQFFQVNIRDDVAVDDDEGVSSSIMPPVSDPCSAAFVNAFNRCFNSSGCTDTICSSCLAEAHNARLRCEAGLP